MRRPLGRGDRPAARVAGMFTHTTASEPVLIHIFQNTVMCGPMPPYTPISAGASTESLAETLFFTPLIPETEKFAEEDAADSLQQREATVIPTIVITAAEQEASPPSPELPRGRSRSRHDPRMYLSPTSSWPSPSTVCRGSPGAVTWQAAPQRPSHSRSGRASKRIGSRRNNMPSWLSPFRCWLADLNLPGRVLYLAACLLAYVGIPLLWAYFTFTSLPKTLHAKVYRWRLSRDD